jgi:2-isopropylmalate synthase
MKPSELVYEWNEEPVKPDRTLEFDDETLRDGLQCPSVTDPPLEKKVELLRLMAKLGIQSADIGLPGAGGVVNEHVTELLKVIRDEQLPIEPNCAARTVIQDIEPVIEISQRVGFPLQVSTFIGSSFIRQYTEDWDLDKLLKTSEEALKFAKSNNLSVMYVTEDTTRAHPETVAALYGLALDYDVERICVCDTVGHATPTGVRNLVRFVRDLVDRKQSKAKVDWHGHMDRGLGIINSVAAFEAGADRVHGTGLGIGERAGNTPMDLLLVNLRLMGWIDNDLTQLGDYCRLVSEAVEVEIPYNYPVFGTDAFETATGVHAAAVIKAMKKGDHWLANRVYSGVPSDLFGLDQRIRVGPMSGKSNVTYWLEQNNIEPANPLVEAILNRAKSSRRLLTEGQLHDLVKEHSA